MSCSPLCFPHLGRRHPGAQSQRRLGRLGLWLLPGGSRGFTAQPQQGAGEGQPFRWCLGGSQMGGPRGEQSSPSLKAGPGRWAQQMSAQPLAAPNIPKAGCLAQLLERAKGYLFSDDLSIPTKPSLEKMPSASF